MLFYSDEMSDAVASLVTVNSSRPGYLVRVLREVKIICEDHRLRPRLLRSLRALRDSHSPNNPLVNKIIIISTKFLIQFRFLLIKIPTVLIENSECLSN